MVAILYNFESYWHNIVSPDSIESSFNILFFSNLDSTLQGLQPFLQYVFSKSQHVLDLTSSLLATESILSQISGVEIFKIFPMVMECLIEKVRIEII